jgi:hypothetical protein
MQPRDAVWPRSPETVQFPAACSPDGKRQQPDVERRPTPGWSRHGCAAQPARDRAQTGAPLGSQHRKPLAGRSPTAGTPSNRCRASPTTVLYGSRATSPGNARTPARGTPARLWQKDQRHLATSRTRRDQHQPEAFRHPHAPTSSPQPADDRSGVSGHPLPPDPDRTSCGSTNPTAQTDRVLARREAHDDHITPSQPSAWLQAVTVVAPGDGGVAAC